jgi:hypothetical protein
MVYDAAGQAEKDIQEGKRLAGQYLPSGSLPRLGTPEYDAEGNITGYGHRSHETNMLGARRYALADPTNPAYAGKFSQDAKGILNMRKSALDPSSKNYAGRRSSDMSDLLGRYKTRMGQFGIGKRSADMADIVGRFKAGLEGYTSPEYQGFREQAERGINSQYATDKRSAMGSMARSGIRGASAGAQMRNMERNRLAQQQQLEQDLFLKSADEKQRRLGAFSQFMRGLEGEEYGRVQKAADKYQDTQGTLEDKYYGRGQTALQNYQDLLHKIQQDEMFGDLFNIGQDEKERGIDVGGTMGFAELIATRRQQERQNEIMEDQ